MERPMRVQSFLEPANLTGRNIFNVDFGDDGTTWVAASDGLHRFDGYHWRRLSMADGLPSDFVRCVMVDRNAACVWVGTNAGVAVLSTTDLSVRRSLTHELAGPNVRRIRRGAAKSIWICSDRWLTAPDSRAGITRIRSATAAPEVFTTKHGLPDDYVMDFYHDSEGRNWALTDNGLGRLEGSRFVAELVDLGPDEASRRFWSMVEGPGGRLLAATRAGLYQRSIEGWIRLHTWRFDNPQMFMSHAGELLIPRPRFLRLLYLPSASLQPDTKFRPNFNPFPFNTGPIRLEDVRTAPDDTIWFVGRNLLVRWMQPGRSTRRSGVACRVTPSSGSPRVAGNGRVIQRASNGSAVQSAANRRPPRQPRRFRFRPRSTP